MLEEATARSPAPAVPVMAHQALCPVSLSMLGKIWDRRWGEA